MLFLAPIVSTACSAAAGLGTHLLAAGSALAAGITIGAKCGRTLTAGATVITAGTKLLTAGTKFLTTGAAVAGAYMVKKHLQRKREHTEQQQRP